MGEIVHWEGVYLPIFGCVAIECNVASQAFAFGTDYFGEVYAARVFDEDIEGCGVSLSRNVEVRLTEAAVECSDGLLIDIDLRVVVESVELELPAVAFVQSGAIEHVSVGLIEIFEGQRGFGIDRCRQVAPKRRA